MPTSPERETSARKFPRPKCRQSHGDLGQGPDCAAMFAH